MVTATVDAIHIIPRPLSLHNDIHMWGKVVWTGSSSMDIAIEVHQEDASTDTTSDKEQSSKQSSCVISALFTFVARDPLTGRSQRINYLEPKTEEEKKIFKIRQQNADKRKLDRELAKTADKKCA